MIEVGDHDADRRAGDRPLLLQRGDAHLQRIVTEAQAIVDKALAG